MTELVTFLQAHAMWVPTDLRDAIGRDVMVLVDDDVPYLEALAR